MRLAPRVLVLSILCALVVGAPTAAAEEPCPFFENRYPETDPPFEIHPECAGYPIYDVWLLVQELLP